MSGNLTHPPSDIVRRLLITKGYGTLPSASGSWPIFHLNEPDNPDNCITIYNTENNDQGRVQFSLARTEYFGVQIRVRDKSSSGVKARTIASALDSAIYRDTVTISSSTYLVQSVNKITGPIYLGRNQPNSNLSLFTINAVVDVKQTT